MDVAEKIEGPALKAADFRPCVLCGKGVMHTRQPLFYRVEIQRYGIDLNEVQRAHGMEQFMHGNVAIARVFHDPDIAKPIVNKVTALVCETCAMNEHPLAVLSELAHEQASKAKPA